MVAFHGEQPLCAGFLYLTLSKLCWLEWLVTNPDAPLKPRTHALECLLGRLKEEAQGFCPGGSVFVTLKSKGLIKLYKKVGFEVSDTHMTNMVCKLWQ